MKMCLCEVVTLFIQRYLRIGVNLNMLSLRFSWDRYQFVIHSLSANENVLSYLWTAVTAT
jgi:hypothetical protein